LNGKIKSPGVQLPISKNLPILKELEEYGVVKNNRCIILAISQIDFFLVLVKQIRLV
jgi:hypothetical protein